MIDWATGFDPTGGAGVSYGAPMAMPSFGAPSAGVLSGAPPPGPLSGASPGGSFWNQSWIGPVAAALMGGRTFRQSLAGAGQAVAQTMPMEQKRQALNAWLQAKSSGDPAALNDAQAKLFQVDPDLAQSVASNLMTPHRTFGQIGVDAMGNQQFGFSDPFAMTVTPASSVTAIGGAATPDGAAPAAPPAGGVQPAAQRAPAAGASPYDQLAAFPGLQQQVDAIIAGRQAPYSQRAASSPGAGRAVMAAVYAKDPTYDEGRYKTRQSFEHEDYAKTIGFGRTAIGHLDDVSQAAAALEPYAAKSGLPFWDYVQNQLSNRAVMGSGTPEAQALAALNTAKQLYAGEITKFYDGAGGGEGDRTQAQGAFDAAKSPAEIQAAAAQQAKMLNSKVSSLQRTYRASGLKEDFPILGPEDQAHLDAVQKRYQQLSGGPTPAGAPPGGIPAPPPTIPPGSAWSPSRHMWRSPDGVHLFDAQGNLVQ